MTRVPPDHPGSSLGPSVALYEQGRFEEARVLCEQVVRDQPDHAAAWHLLGLIAFQTSRPVHAVTLIEKSIEIFGQDARAYNHRGNALLELREFDAAVASYDQALSLKPDFAEAYYNRGNALLDSMRLREATADYVKSIELNPRDERVHYNLGGAYSALGKFAAAVAQFDQVIAIKPDHTDAHYNRGNALRELKHFDAAIASYDRAIALGDSRPFLRGLRLHTRMHVCEWVGFETEMAELTRRIEAGEAVATPLAVLALSGSPALQRSAAEAWTREYFPPGGSAPPFHPSSGSDKLRIGYFSADYHDHATSHLLAGLLETHDRSKVEVIALSFGPDTQDPMQARIARACDQLIDVRAMSDQELVQFARRLQLDIAVDLKGYTGNGRPGIFALRAAPLQVSWLGFPGTLGANYMDYLIADRIVVPEESKRHYCEKIIYLPNSYQVNDSRRPISDQTFSRHELGLPPQGLIFCCFNTSHKILPATFDGWMRILKCAGSSVLWLLETNTLATTNLRREAAIRGVDPSRLIFAVHMPPAEHLARHRAADLFLDTAPYNAHTTASDALWAGVPVVTCQGESFAGRVAASLLTAVGLPELIARDQSHFEQLAVQLAFDSARLSSMRRKLNAQRSTAPLFNTTRFTAHIETAYREIYERYRAGMPAEHLDVKSN